MKNAVKMITATMIVDLQDGIVDMTPLLEEAVVTIPPPPPDEFDVGWEAFIHDFGQFGGPRSSKQARSRNMTGKSIPMSDCRSTPLLFEQSRVTIE